jgi:hypothetical protein
VVSVRDRRAHLLVLLFDNLSTGAYMFSVTGPDKVTMQTEWADGFQKAICEPWFQSGGQIREGDLATCFDSLVDDLIFTVAA